MVVIEFANLDSLVRLGTDVHILNSKIHSLFLVGKPCMLKGH